MWISLIKWIETLGGEGRQVGNMKSINKLAIKIKLINYWGWFDYYTRIQKDFTFKLKVNYLHNFPFILSQRGCPLILVRRNWSPFIFNISLLFRRTNVHQFDRERWRIIFVLILEWEDFRMIDIQWLGLAMLKWMDWKNVRKKMKIRDLLEDEWENRERSA